jgi:hypothetical protein
MVTEDIACQWLDGTAVSLNSVLFVKILTDEISLIKSPIKVYNSLKNDRINLLKDHRTRSILLN